MGLFDKKTDKIDFYEEQYRAVKAETVRITRKIGELFIAQNMEKDMSDTPYAELLAVYAENQKKYITIERQKLAAQGLRKCDSCGAELPIDSVFCNKCGAKQSELENEIITAGKKCPNCGADIENGDSFCLKCGHKL